MLSADGAAKRALFSFHDFFLAFLPCVAALSFVSIFCIIVSVDARIGVGFGYPWGHANVSSCCVFSILCDFWTFVGA